MSLLELSLEIQPRSRFVDSKFPPSPLTAPARTCQVSEMLSRPAGSRTGLALSLGQTRNSPSFIFSSILWEEEETRKEGLIAILTKNKFCSFIENITAVMPGSGCTELVCLTVAALGVQAGKKEASDTVLGIGSSQNTVLAT